MLEVAAFTSPVGRLAIASHEDRVCALWFGTEPQVRTLVERWFPNEPVSAGSDPGGAVSALTAYFSGNLNALDAVEVEFHGTPFQQRVWRQLRLVRAGTTASYSQIARAIGAPHAVRAVGAANGANPVAVIVPCHRIIGSNGSLTGYGGGLDRKRWLLAHESPAGQARLTGL
jgi:methylated-DNA-[protein]-cysteine S-methyltransferase